MERLTATFRVALSAPILVRTDREQFRYTVVVDGYEVGLTFAPDMGAGSKDKDGPLWKRLCHEVEVRVSRSESEAWPEVVPDSAGRRDLTVQDPYFDSRRKGYQDAATTVLNNALRFFKYELRHPFVEFLRPIDQRVQNVQWTDETGRVAESGGVHLIVVPFQPGLRASGFGMIHLEDSHDEALRGALTMPRAPELHEQILSDAQAAVLQQNVRRAVLELALACEVLVKHFFFGTSRAGQVFEHLEDRRQVNVRVIDLLDGVAASVLGESFRAADKAGYNDLDNLFRARNKVAHRGEAIYKDDGGIRHEVTVSVLHGWWDSVMRLLSWLGARTAS